MVIKLFYVCGSDAHTTVDVCQNFLNLYLRRASFTECKFRLNKLDIKRNVRRTLVLISLPLSLAHQEKGFFFFLILT